MKNIPILTFISRNFLLILVTLFANFLSLWNHVFIWVRDDDGTLRGLTLAHIIGAPIYAPGLILIAFMGGLLAKHLLYRDTIDKDIENGTYIADWHATTSTVRICCTTAVIVGFTHAFSIIAASLAK